MVHSVIHWEIAGQDGAKLSAFYRDLFAWELTTFDERYWMVQPGSPDGVGGGIMQVEGPPRVTIYVQVDDLQTTLDSVMLLGGRTVRDPEPIPGIGRFALFEDIAGNVIGLIEPA
jgi:predicted enzyme related to lactoylglutathione lyase